MKTDLDYMKRARDLAMRARGKTSPNPMVGAVIVKGGQIIAEGFHRRCGGDHAEMAALKKAKEKARGAALYVTLEPCGHFGKTPPCVEAVIKSGIKKVIVGMIDPNPLNNGKSFVKLRRAGITVKTGILQKELHKMNESFVKFITRKMPFVVVKWAQTLDGKIAAENGQSKWITSVKARDMAHRLRDDFDAIMVGVRTVLNDNPFLNSTAKGKVFRKIIVDTRLKTPLRANLFKDTKPENIIFAATADAPKATRLKFIKKSYQVVICPKKKEGVDLKWLLKDLAKRKITSVLVEGGGALIGSLLKERLADKLMAFVAPKIMGDQDAISAVKGFRIQNINRLIRLKDFKLQKIGEDFLVTAYV